MQSSHLEKMINFNCEREKKQLKKGTVRARSQINTTMTNAGILLKEAIKEDIYGCMKDFDQFMINMRGGKNDIAK